MAKRGCDGTTRGRMAASIDASGTALGTIGLAAFGLVLWLLLPTQSPWLVIPLAAVAWAIVAGSLWEAPPPLLVPAPSRPPSRSTQGTPIQRALIRGCCLLPVAYCLLL